MNKLISWSALVVAVAAISFSVWSHVSAPKIAYVDLNSLFADFDMTKELDLQFTNTSQKRETMLDSLEAELKLLSTRLQADNENIGLAQTFNMKRQEYSIMKERFDKDNGNQSAQYQQQIIEQLNQYVQDYQEESGYDIIYGASGNGTLMAGNEDYNVTDEVLKYINSKYQGSNS